MYHFTIILLVIILLNIYTDSNHEFVKNISIEARPVGCEVSPDGRWVYISVWPGSNLYIIDTSTDEIDEVVNIGFTLTEGIALNHDGSRLYLAGYHSNIIKVLDTETRPRQIVNQIDAGAQYNGGVVTIDPMKDEIYIGTSPDVRVLNLNGNLLTTYPYYFSSVVFSPCKPTEAYACSNYQLHIINTTNRVIERSIHVPNNNVVTQLCINKTETRLYGEMHSPTGVGDSHLLFIDLESFEIIDQIYIGEIQASDIVCQADGSYVYIPATSPSGDYVSIVNTETREIKRIIVGNYPSRLSITPDGSKIYVANNGSANASVIKYNLTQYNCSGFEPPMANGPVKVKKNRVLPLKTQLFDKDGIAITDLDITSPPVIQVIYDSGQTGDPIDVTDQALPAGTGTEGNQFEFTVDNKWQYNLKTSNYTAIGTYSIYIKSSDSLEYIIDQTSYTPAKFVTKE